MGFSAALLLRAWYSGRRCWWLRDLRIWPVGISAHCRDECPEGQDCASFLGEVVDYLVEAGGGEIRVRTKPELDFRIGQAVYVSVAPGRCVGLPSCCCG